MSRRNIDFVARIKTNEAVTDIEEIDKLIERTANNIEKSTKGLTKELSASAKEGFKTTEMAGKLAKGVKNLYTRHAEGYNLSTKALARLRNERDANNEAIMRAENRIERLKDQSDRFYQRNAKQLSDTLKARDNIIEKLEQEFGKVEELVAETDRLKSLEQELSNIPESENMSPEIIERRKNELLEMNSEMQKISKNLLNMESDLSKVNDISDLMSKRKMLLDMEVKDVDAITDISDSIKALSNSTISIDIDKDSLNNQYYLKSVIEELNSKINFTRDYYAGMAKVIDEKELGVKEVEKLINSLDVLKESRDFMLSDLKVNESNIKDLENSIISMKESMREPGFTNADKERLEELKKEIKDTEDRLKVAGVQAKQAREMAHHAKHSKDATIVEQAELGNLIQEATKLEGIMDQHSSTVKILSDEYDKLSKKKVASDEAQALAPKLEEAKQELTRANIEAFKLNEELAQTNKEIKMIELDPEKLRADLELDIKENQNEIKELEKSLGGLNVKLEETNDRASRLKIAPQSSAEIKRINANLKESNLSLERHKNLSSDIKDRFRMGGSIDTEGLSKGLSKVGDLVKRTFDTSILKRFDKNIKGISKSTSIISKKISGLGSRIVNIGKTVMVYQVIRKLFGQMRNHMGDLIQTSGHLQSSLTNLSNNILVAFQPIWNVALPALQLLVQWLNTAAVAVGKFFARITGQSYEAAQSQVAGMKKQKKELENQKKGHKDIGKEAKKAGKEIEEAAKQTQGFDQLNIMSDDKVKTPDIESSLGDLDPLEQDIVINEGEISSKMNSLLDKMGDKIAEFFEVFQKAWSNQGESVIDQMKKSLESVMKLASSIGSTLMEVWTNGTGQQFVENLLIGFRELLRIVENLADNLRLTWEENDAGLRLVQSLGNHLVLISEFMGDVFGRLADWVGEVNLTPLMESIIEFSEVMEDVMSIIYEGLLDLWDNILEPIFTWLVEDILPRFIKIWTRIGELFIVVREALEPLAKTLMEDFIKPLGERFGEGIENGLDSVIEKLENLTTWISENGEEFREFVTKGAKLAGIVATIIGAAKIDKSIRKGYGNLIEDNKLLGSILSSTGDKAGEFASSMGSGMAKSLEKSGDSLKNWVKNLDMSEVWDSIKNGVKNIPNLFKDLPGKLKDMLGGLKNLFSFDTIKNIFSGLGGKLGDLLGFIGKFLSGLNPVVVIIGLVIAAVTDLMLRNEEFRERVGETLEGLRETLTLLWENVLEPIFTYVKEAAADLWESLQPMWEAIRDAIGELIVILLDLWDNALKPIVDFIIKYILPIILKVGSFLVDVLLVAVKVLAKGIEIAAKLIGLVIKGIGLVIDTVVTAATKTIQWGVDKFKGIWDTLTGIFEGPIQGIKDMWNGVLDFFKNLFDDISGFVSRIFGKKKEAEGAESSTRSLVNSSGGAPSSPRPLSLSDMTPVSRANPGIPMLAKGGLIPSRKPRQVIVGDNRHEDEIVSPVSTMKDAFRDVMVEMGGSGGVSSSEMMMVLTNILHAIEQGQTIELNQRELGRTVVKSVSDARRQTGTQLF